MDRSVGCLETVRGYNFKLLLLLRFHILLIHILVDAVIVGRSTEVSVWRGRTVWGSIADIDCNFCFPHFRLLFHRHTHFNN